MTNHRREYRERTHRIREFITSMADGFYWKLEVIDEDPGEDWPFQPPIVFGADGTAGTEQEAKKHLERAISLYRSRYGPR